MNNHSRSSFHINQCFYFRFDYEYSSILSLTSFFSSLSFLVRMSTIFSVHSSFLIAGNFILYFHNYVCWRCPMVDSRMSAVLFPFLKSMTMNLNDLMKWKECSASRLVRFSSFHFLCPTVQSAPSLQPHQPAPISLSTYLHRRYLKIEQNRVSAKRNETKTKRSEYRLLSEYQSRHFKSKMASSWLSNFYHTRRCPTNKWY